MEEFSGRDASSTETQPPPVADATPSPSSTTEALSGSRPVVFRHRHTVGQDPDNIDGVLAKNRRVATPFMISKCEREAARSWDMFYKRHEDRFFKNKNWTEREFAQELGKMQGDAAAPVLAGGDGDSAEEKQQQPGIVEKEAAAHQDTVLLEVGSGPGNTLYPILTFNDQIKAHVCDFSARAIDILKLNPKFTTDRVNAFVYDLVKEEPQPLEDLVSVHPFGRPTLVSLVFVLSAIPPQHHRRVLQGLAATLRPGGTLCFRDFAHGDLAQLRFHQKASAAWCEPALLSDSHDFYRRGDNTLTYFFSIDELEAHARALGLEGTIEPIEIHGLNRRTGVKLHRRFIQAKWKRAAVPSAP